MDGARTALEAANREDAAGGGGAAASAAATQKEPAQRTLRTFLETFISEEFLPEVYVNFRCGGTLLLKDLNRHSQACCSSDACPRCYLSVLLRRRY